MASHEADSTDTYRAYNHHPQPISDAHAFIPTEKHFLYGLGKDQPCGLGAEDMPNSADLSVPFWNTYSITIKGNGVMLVSQKDISHSEQGMEMSSEKTRDSISATSTIYEFMHPCRSEKEPWHFIRQWWKSNRDPAWWFKTGEGFQDKAAIKNEWLFATNTVAAESFMGHVMEKE